jgi:adenylate cyclase class 2
MSIETEVKVRLRDRLEFRKRLDRLPLVTVAARHFEDNLVLDYPDGRLKSEACLLRLRSARGEGTITFKGPPQPSELFKRREEIETSVGRVEPVLRILARLGLTVWFRYQKFREEFDVSVKGGAAPPVRLAIDSTPVGDFAELEGTEDGIREVAVVLGIPEADFLRDSYYAIFVNSCREEGREAKDMVFPDRREGEESGSG